MVERARAAGTVEGAREEEPSSSAVTFFVDLGTGTGTDELPPPVPFPFEPPLLSAISISLCLTSTLAVQAKERGRKARGKAT